MADAFKEGDVVKHRAGGPAMIVQAVAKDGYRCSWITAGGTPHVKTYGKHELRFAKRENTA